MEDLNFKKKDEEKQGESKSAETLRDEKILRDGGNELVRDAEIRLEKREDKEKGLIDSIKRMILDEKAGLHSPYGLRFSEVMDNSYLKERALKILRNIFQIGIRSHMELTKRGITEVGDGSFIAQNDSFKYGQRLLRKIGHYLVKMERKGIDIRDVSYEDIINEENLDTYSYGEEIGLEKEKERGRLILEIIKKDDWTKRWRIPAEERERRGIRGPEWNDDCDFYPIKCEGDIPGEYHLINKLYGTNLISSIDSKDIKESYEEEGLIPTYFSDMGILFKLPHSINRRNIHPGDVGVRGVIPVKNFVAIVINKKLTTIPQEFLDIIPQNIPVVSTDFKVIRMPDEESPM